jgi:regulatory protein
MTEHSARNIAMDLLARRDHSRKQLREKLRKRGFDSAEIEAALDGLQRDRLLDEQRFADSYMYQRVNKGFGPLRIRQELRERGVSSEVITALLEVYSNEWHESMRQQRAKKFGAELPEDQRERMKQARFLQNRGFSPESVMRLFRR